MILRWICIGGLDGFRDGVHVGEFEGTARLGAWSPCFWWVGYQQRALGNLDVEGDIFFLTALIS